MDAEQIERETCKRHMECAGAKTHVLNSAAALLDALVNLVEAATAKIKAEK